MEAYYNNLDNWFHVSKSISLILISLKLMVRSSYTSTSRAPVMICQVCAVCNSKPNEGSSVIGWTKLHHWFNLTLLLAETFCENLFMPLHVKSKAKPLGSPTNRTFTFSTIKQEIHINLYCLAD